MADTLKASPAGLEKVDRARQRKGWTKTRTPAWWDAAYTTQATLKRFWRGIAIQRENFIAICQAVGIEDWQQVAQLPDVPELATREKQWQDWGAAPDIPSFYGRKQERETLQRWIEEDRCKLLILLGMGGIGKTSLAVTVAQKLQDRFEGLIWRSLLPAPPLSELLDSLLQFLSQGQETLATDNIQQGITRAIAYLQQHRCLIVLDEAEAIFRSHRQQLTRRRGQYLDGYEDYGEFFLRLARDRHQSCILLTSREKPGEVISYEGKKAPVRSLHLKGLQAEDAIPLFRDKGFASSDNELRMLINFYSGNPLALKAIASMIQEVFAGNVAAFLDQNTLVLGDRLRGLLAQQVNCLPELETEVLYWLTIAGRPLPLSQLRGNLLFPPSQSQLLEALAALERRGLMDKATPTSQQQEILFTLQPLVMKYVTETFVERALEEIVRVLESGDIAAFRVLKNHAIAANSQPPTAQHPPTRLLGRLQEGLKLRLRCDEAQIGQQLRTMLPLLRGQSLLAIGYVGSNLQILCRGLGTEPDLENWQDIPLM